MQHSQFPLTRDLVLVGGGHCHALVLRKWGMKPLPGVRITVINPGPTAPYSGMLPGFLAGHYEQQELDIDLVQLSRFAEARLILGTVNGLDQDQKVISIQGGPKISFDIASVDIGITTEIPNLPGFEAFAVPAKPLGTFAAKWARYREKDTAAQVAIIGGGVAGIEIALSFAHSLKTRNRPFNMTVVDNTEALQALRPQARSKLIAATAEAGINILENADVVEITQKGLVLRDARFVPADFVCGAAGARPQDWLKDTKLELKDGFIQVSQTLQSSNPNVFAAGDCAHMREAPRPKAGVFAVRQAETLYSNLRSALSETGNLKRYKPQKDYLKLISLGGKTALGDRFGATFQGPAIWRWKNHIDKTFMAKFQSLPSMEGLVLPKEHAAGLKEEIGDKPKCGGCGSKVSQPALKHALAQIPSPHRADVTHLPGDDAALLCIRDAKQVISTDHLKAFTSDPIAMTKIAANHALGDIWSMGASPQAATATVILPQMSSILAQRTLEEIMIAAEHVFSQAGAAIVGGHSSQGSELTIGFTVTGLCDKAPITLSGASPGQSLILTKPIGTGVVMAAAMLGYAKGSWVAEAVDQMSQSQSIAADILAQASAMTDVTGFGLAGHLMNLCQSSNLGAILDLSAVQTLPGALELAARPVRSTLFPENKRVLPDTPSTPKHDLLFDPQTSGGLLAAISADPAPIIAKLQDAGYNAALIGETTDQCGHISIR